MTAVAGRRISAADRRRRLVHRQQFPACEGATTDGGGPLAVARSLAALHSSDPVSVYLSVLARLPEATVDEVSAALYEDRDLVRVHGMRRTLWVADVETASAVVGASAARLVRAERSRLAKLLSAAGLTEPDRWIDEARLEILNQVLAAGVTDTRAVGEELPHLTVGLEVAGGKKYSATLSAHTRVLLILGYEGSIVRADPRGTWIASQYQWADPELWLGRPLQPEGGTAPETVARGQAEVIECYLRSFGPVTTDDVVWWTGWPKGAVGKALAAIGAVEVDTDIGPAWLTAEDVAAAEDHDDDDRTDQAVALLPALDPSTMGWKQRHHYLDPEHTAQLFDRFGNAGPTIWVGGRIVGGWAQRDDGELVYRLLSDVGSEAVTVIEDGLDRLAARIGDTRYRVRFPNPLNTELRKP